MLGSSSWSQIAGVPESSHVRFRRRDHGHTLYPPLLRKHLFLDQRWCATTCSHPYWWTSSCTAISSTLLPSSGLVHIHSFTHSFIYLFIHLFTHSSIHPFMFASLSVDKGLHGNTIYPMLPALRLVHTHSYIYSFNLSCAHSFILSCVHSFIHSFFHVRIPIGG